MTASTLTINRDEYPNLIPDGAEVGDRVRITLTGVVRRIEGELVDVTGYGAGRDYSIGATEVELLVVEARPLG